MFTRSFFKTFVMSARTLLICLIIVAEARDARSQANTSLSNLSNPTSINRDLLPSLNNVRTLGSSARSWRSIYIDDAYYLQDRQVLTGNVYKQNIFVGHYAGNASVTGSGNTFVGYHSGRYNSSGKGNTFNGYYAGGSNMYSQYTSAFGYLALYSLKAINYNSAFGAYAAYSLTGGGYNAVFGYQAMKANKTGGRNSVFGTNAMYTSTSGSDNAFFGYQAGMTNKGSYNAFFGSYAGSTVKGSNNTFIGYHAAGFVDSVKNATALGYYTIITASNQVRIGNYAITSIGGFRPWSNLSDGRFKKDVKENVPGLEFINKLRPVTYTVKKKELGDYYRRVTGAKEEMPAVENEEEVMTGFVAQEVEAAAKELNFAFDGVDAPKNEHDLYALRYAEFVVPLVKSVQELSKQIEERDSVIAEFKEILNDIARRDGRPLPFDMKTGLLQNYPNPVSNSTVVEYSLPEKFRRAEIMLTDAGGKMLQRFSLGSAQKGNVTLNMATLASGTYNYSLIIDGKIVNSKKLSVVR